MAPRYLLGIDSGLTVTKAALFDLDGKAVGIGRASTPQLFPVPGHVERDMEALWSTTTSAIQACLAEAAIPTGAIAGIGVTGHGDGLYPLDRDGAPLGNAILSLDSRAVEIVDEWRQTGVLSRSLDITGQHPHAAAPSTILAWLKRHEPERYGQIGWTVYCKDWLRFRLTGTIATDTTEASVSFTNVRSQDYDPEVLSLFGLAELGDALPPIRGVTEITGTVTGAAACETGLAEGTPVVAGLHDVTATSIGTGSISTGQLCVVAGTYSINEVLSQSPAIDERWFCRNGFRPGEWNNMAISPASSANSEWMLQQFFRDALDTAHGTPFDQLQGEITAAFERESRLVYHPFLFGSPYGGHASASLLGLQGWHQRGDVMRAVFEGIAFNHKDHVDALRTTFPIDKANLAGGAARNPLFGQLLADALDLEIRIVDHEEVGALGAALTAGIGVGCYPSFESAADATRRVLRVHVADQARHQHLVDAHRRYRAAIEHVAPLWAALRH